MSKKLAKNQPVQTNQSKQTADMQAEKKRLTLAIGAVVIGVVMAVISWIILPDSVATQFKGFDTGAPNVPKLVAVALPLGITVLCAWQSLKIPDSIKICLVGYAANILFWISNM